MVALRSLPALTEAGQTAGVGRVVLEFRSLKACRIVLPIWQRVSLTLPLITARIQFRSSRWLNPPSTSLLARRKSECVQGSHRNCSFSVRTPQSGKAAFGLTVLEEPCSRSGDKPFRFKAQG